MAEQATLPSLSPVYLGRSTGTVRAVVRQVRTQGDIEILKSYLLLVWSEWDPVDYLGLTDIRTSIGEDFSGIGMGRDRESLSERLDQVSGRLNRGSGSLKQRRRSICGHNIQRAKGQYVWLKGILLELNREALEMLTRTSSVDQTISIRSPQRADTESHSPIICALPFPCSQLPHKRSARFSFPGLHSRLSLGDYFVLIPSPPQPVRSTYTPPPLPTDCRRPCSTYYSYYP